MHDCASGLLAHPIIELEGSGWCLNLRERLGNRVVMRQSGCANWDGRKFQICSTFIFNAFYILRQFGNAPEFGEESPNKQCAPNLELDDGGLTFSIT